MMLKCPIKFTMNMRHIVLVILFGIYAQNMNAQNQLKWEKFPFDVETLRSLSYKKDSIMPRFISGKFYYVNIKTNKIMGNEGYEVAYPFVGRKSAIIKRNGKYGAVNRKGKLLVEPSFNSFQLWHTPMRENMVAFDNNANHVFDLSQGEFVIPGNGCAEPYVERATVFSFKGGTGKYGIYKIDENQSHKTVIKPIYDSIYLIKSQLIIAKKNNKIGVIDENDNIIVPFIYENIVVAKPKYFTIPNLIGLKNETNWEYYQLSNKPILLLKSEFKCQNIGEIIVKKGFGIYNHNDKYNILFYDGSSLKNEYDWISNDGTLAIQDDKVYILGDDGIPFLYY